MLITDLIDTYRPSNSKVLGTQQAAAGTLESRRPSGKASKLPQEHKQAASSTTKKTSKTTKLSNQPKAKAVKETMAERGDQHLEEEAVDVVSELPETTRRTTSHRTTRSTSAESITPSEGYYTGDITDRRRAPAAAIARSTSTTTGTAIALSTDLADLLKTVTIQNQQLISELVRGREAGERKHKQEARSMRVMEARWETQRQEDLEAQRQREEQLEEQRQEELQIRREEIRARRQADEKRERLCAIQLTPPMTWKADLLEYLELFEGVARRKELPEEDWAPTVIPLLSHRFRATAVKLPQETREVYDTLKMALLERDDAITKNAAASFWSLMKRQGTTALEFGQQVRRLADRFLEGDDRASCLDSLSKERFIQELPKEGRAYVRQGLCQAKKA